MQIIATIGPKSTDKWIIKELIENGVDILRLNCSHFNKEEFEYVIKFSKEIKRDVHILVDLCGKKIRVSKELKYIYKIYNGQEVYFCGEDFYSSIDTSKLKEMKLIPLTIGTEEIIKSDIKAISMKDNTMNFEIIEIDKGVIKTKVLRGGIIRGGKGCNLSNIYDDKAFLSEKDKENILWALDNDVDIICQSFVERKEDIKIINKLIKETYPNNKCKLWAKVETPTGINNIKEILELTDSIIIGRGDLVPESGILNAVNLQEQAIKTIKENDKKVIVATHILNSMKNGHPATLPEIESIYKFIKCGINGFLLAGETSIGKAPIQTVKFLKNAIEYYSIGGKNE